MFIILVYDVAAQRDHKMQKLCERYLQHVQRSLFEGIITDARLEKLKQQIRKIIDPEYDECTIYKLDSLKYTAKEEIGRVSLKSNIL